MWWGDESLKEAVKTAQLYIRNSDNFHWLFITLLAIVVYIYANEIQKKNYKAVVAGLSLYMVHWLYEIANAVISSVSGYALWSVSAESTSLMLLIGVSWELSMMFSIAGLTMYKLLPEDPKAKILGINNRWLFAIGNAAFFSAVEIYLAATPAFNWVYSWWGVIPVFITTYIPFFLAAFFIPDKEPKIQKLFIGGLAIINVTLLAILIPLGIV